MLLLLLSVIIKLVTLFFCLIVINNACELFFSPAIYIGKKKKLLLFFCISLHLFVCLCVNTHTLTQTHASVRDTKILGICTQFQINVKVFLVSACLYQNKAYIYISNNNNNKTTTTWKLFTSTTKRSQRTRK